MHRNSKPHSAHPAATYPSGNTRRDLLRLSGLACASALLPAVLSGCGGSDAAPIEVVYNDVPYPTEKNMLFGYMLSTWEFEREGLKLDKIIIVDMDTGDTLRTVDQPQLPSITRGELGWLYGVQFDTLTRYLMSPRLAVPLERTPPRAIVHRLVFTNGRVVEGGAMRLRTVDQPRLIGSPLAAKNLVFAHQSTMGYHYNMMFPRQGTIYTFERYAFDAIQYDDALSLFYAGDPTVNTSHFIYGLPLYAVADGVVVQTVDGQPENHGTAADLKINTLDELAGNAVLLDIGGGHYAGYAHCIPGSIKVRKGDRVRKGDLLALVGNSGNSKAPHLHFQVTDAHDFIWSMAVPFVIDAYTKVGEMENVETGNGRRVAPQSFTHALMEETTVIDIST